MSLPRCFAAPLLLACGLWLVASPAMAQNESQEARRQRFEEMRARLTERMLKQFDTANPQIPIENLHAGCPRKDCIPALTMPKRVAVSAADFPPPSGRVVSVELNGQAVAYPIAILNYHEAVNDVVGGEPILVTWCPLCDSAAVMKRTIATDDGKTQTLEFGIAGFLLYSNMVLYDKTTNGLWSQIFMKAITGPLAGTHLEHLPVRVEPFAAFKARHPRGEVLSRETGYDAPYDRNVYEPYLNSPDVPPQFAFEFDQRLPAKTRGAGVVGEGFALFVPESAIPEDGLTVQTPAGPVKIRRNDAGVFFEEVPQGVSAIQAFYHSFSAFHKGCTIYSPDGAGR